MTCRRKIKNCKKKIILIIINQMHSEREKITNKCRNRKVTKENETDFKILFKHL